MTTRAVDADFLSLPLDRLADVALQIASQRGATYADFRVERLRSHIIVARDRELQTSVESETVGFSVRVVAKGAWGFAAGIDLTTEAVSAVARRAVEVAEALSPLNTEPVVLADEPVYNDTYVSSYEIDPFAVREDQENRFSARTQRSRARIETDRPRHLARHAGPRAEIPGLSCGVAHRPAAGSRERRPDRRAHRQGHWRFRDDGKRGAAGREGMGVLHDGLRLGKGRRRHSGAAGAEDGVALRQRRAVTTSSSIRPTYGSRFTSRSATRPSSTVCSDTRRTTRAHRSQRSISSTLCNSAHR